MPIGSTRTGHTTTPSMMIWCSVLLLSPTARYRAVIELDSFGSLEKSNASVRDVPERKSNMSAPDMFFSTYQVMLD